MKQKCNKCKYEWEFKGKAKFYATCPRCMQKVKIRGKNEIKNK